MTTTKPATTKPATTKPAVTEAPAEVLPVKHRHDKALNDALSAIGRIESKLPTYLRRARVRKGLFTKHTTAELDCLSEAEVKSLKLHSAVLSAYNALEEAINALA